MPDTMLGHNAPPLAEALPLETEDLRARADRLLEASKKAAITDADTAKQAVELVKMIGEHVKEVEKARTTRKAPVLAAGKEIDGHFKVITEPLVSAKTAVTDLIDAYRKASGADQVRSEYGAVAHDKPGFMTEVVDARAFVEWLFVNDLAGLSVALTFEAARIAKGGITPPGVTVTAIHKTAVR